MRGLVGRGLRSDHRLIPSWRDGGGENPSSSQVASKQNGKRVTGISRLDDSFKEWYSKRTKMRL